MDEHRKNVLNRLRRIEGQIRGLERMVEQEAPCADVLTQLHAATAAMKKNRNCHHSDQYEALYTGSLR